MSEQVEDHGQGEALPSQSEGPVVRGTSVGAGQGEREGHLVSGPGISSSRKPWAESPSLSDSCCHLRAVGGGGASCSQHAMSKSPQRAGLPACCLWPPGSQGLQVALPHRRSRVGGGGGGGPFAACGGALAAGTAAAGTVVAREEAAAAAAATVRTQSQRKPRRPGRVARRCRQHRMPCRTWTCGCRPGRAPVSHVEGEPRAGQDAVLPPPALPGAPARLRMAAEPLTPRPQLPRRRWARRTLPPGSTAPAQEALGTQTRQTLASQAPRSQQIR